MTLLLPPQTSLQDRVPNRSTPTYYEQPALKPSPWGWMVSGYMFIAGLAGSAQILATAADLAGGDRYRVIVRNGRYLAVAGAAAGAPLLIGDLHTPQRFYNMLRIFRPTSPMSIGSYVLLGFTGCSAVLVVAQLRRDTVTGPSFMEAVARAIELPAAALGAAMSTYTGALLGLPARRSGPPRPGGSRRCSAPRRWPRQRRPCRWSRHQGNPPLSIASGCSQAPASCL